MVLFTQLKNDHIHYSVKNSVLASDTVDFWRSVERRLLPLPHVILAFFSFPPQTTWPYYFPHVVFWLCLLTESILCSHWSLWVLCRFGTAVSSRTCSYNKIHLLQVEGGMLAVSVNEPFPSPAFFLEKMSDTDYVSHFHKTCKCVLARKACRRIGGVSFYCWAFQENCFAPGGCVPSLRDRIHTGKGNPGCSR